ANWTASGGVYFTTQNHTFAMPSNAYALTANATAIFTVSGTVTNTGGSPIGGAVVLYKVSGIAGISGTATDATGQYVITVDGGTTVEITGVIKSGYDDITLSSTYFMNQDYVGVDFQMTAAPTPTPTPTPTSYNITATSDSTTRISPQGTIRVSVGADQTFYFSADAGYYIGSVLVDGRSLSRAEIDLGYYTFYNVNSPHTISVLTEAGPNIMLRIIVVEGSGYAEYRINNGLFQRYNQPVAVPEHANIAVRAFADDMYVFDGWGDSGGIYRNSDYAKQDLTESLYLELHFKKSSGHGFGDLGSSIMWWILAAIALALLVGFLIWFLIYRGYCDVVKVGYSTEIVGKDRVRRRSEYRFFVAGGFSGAVSYRVGEDGSWKVLYPMPNGEYAIPKGEITDTVTIECR
ncbi:MAG: carboxypeptidase-like regulatory domain-containing protein, partial [Methanomassiliicoccaceae archaeon]|nr:carboxypeptidase-like regulatory domain-containing protein [Methanomassiliicoccaceae archaeon]